MISDLFLELLLKSGALKFGEFKTKSGRLSPYFFNTGCFNSAHIMGAVSEHYAVLIAEKFGHHGINNLFGPAYKGIPLAVMIADRLAKRLGRDVSFTFNRKERKDHGEQGLLVGYDYSLKSDVKIVVVEDVLTGGTSLRETYEFLKPFNLEILGIAVGIDREERGLHFPQKTAKQEMEELFGVKIYPVITLTEIVSRLHNQEFLGKIWINNADFKKIQDYQAQFGFRG